VLPQLQVRVATHNLAATARPSANLVGYRLATSERADPLRLRKQNTGLAMERNVHVA